MDFKLLMPLSNTVPCLYAKSVLHGGHVSEPNYTWTMQVTEPQGLKYLGNMMSILERGLVEAFKPRLYCMVHVCVNLTTRGQCR